MKRSQPLLIIGATILIVIVWAMLFFLPKRSSVSDANADRENVEQQIRALETAIAELQSDDGQADDDELRQALEEAVPSEPALADFIRANNNIASAAGINWVSITPSEPAGSGTGLSTISLTIQVGGTFNAILDYLNQLLPADVTGFGRLVIVDGLTLQSEDASSTVASPNLSVSMTARMFTSAAPVSSDTGTDTGSTAGNTGASGETAPTTTAVPATPDTGSSTSGNT